MHFSNLINVVLATTLAFTPLWTSSGSIQIHEEVLSTVSDSSCYAFQPDLSVGKLIYYKGEATVNGAEPKAGAYLQNGDILNTALDGFVALELSDGTVLSIQPATRLSLVCNKSTTIAKQKEPVNVGMPYLSGAVRG